MVDEPLVVLGGRERTERRRATEIAPVSARYLEALVLRRPVSKVQGTGGDGDAAGEDESVPTPDG